jgi:hypothetical protein
MTYTQIKNILADEPRGRAPLRRRLPASWSRARTKDDNACPPPDRSPQQRCVLISWLRPRRRRLPAAAHSGGGDLPTVAPQGRERRRQNHTHERDGCGLRLRDWGRQEGRGIRV